MAILEREIEFSKKVLELIEAEGPRGPDGDLAPYWRISANRIRKGVEQGELYLKNEREAKEHGK